MKSPGRSSLLILLHCKDVREALDWKLLNEPWISSEPSRICNVSFAKGQFQCTDMATLEAVFPDDEGGDLLLCTPSWNLTPTWRDTVRRANALFPVKSVTGRRLVEAVRHSASEHFEDRTPALVSRHITEWNVSGAIHGIACSRLPEDLLWISADARAAMFHCLSMSSTFGDAVDRFYDENLMPRNFGKNLYLSDFVAFQR